MKVRQFMGVAVLTLFSSVALAYHCTIDMRKIDAALEKNPKLSDAQLSEIKKMRLEGASLHDRGNHKESVEVLGKAMSVLGIK